MAAPSADATAAGRYSKMESLRSAVLLRAIECAKLTIPAICPPLGWTEALALPTPWQSIGGRGLNNLASKLLLALFPVNVPFVKLVIDEFTAQRMSGQANFKASVDTALATIERVMMQAVEQRHWRSGAIEVLKHLLVTGNALLHVSGDTLRVFGLHHYCVLRDPEGNPIEIVLKECVAPAALPADVAALIDEEAGEVESDAKKPEDVSAEKTVDLYTHLWFDEGMWHERQEIKGIIVPGSEGTHTKELCPFLPLRLIRVDGDSYGRSYVEDCLGDLRSLEGLRQAIVEGSAISAKILFLIRPNATATPKSLANTPNGGFVTGNADDIKALQVEKGADLRVAFEQAQDLTRSLELHFLLTAGIQRSGERVTAEEIRRLAEDLEKGLGGLYTLLAQEFQLRLVTILMDSLEKTQRIPTLPKNVVKPSIVGGLEALGRGNDLSNLQGLIQDLQPFMQFLAQRLNVDDLVKRLAAARGIPFDGLMIDQQVAAQAQQGQQTQQMTSDLMSKVAPVLAKAAAEGKMGDMQQAGA